MSKQSSRGWSAWRVFAAAITASALVAVAPGCGSDSNTGGSPGTGGTTAGNCGGLGSKLANCNGVCVDPQNDPTNCGSCGVACAQGEYCSQGACASTCGGGTTACNGKCVDTNVDPANCGACGTPCQQGEVCSLGSCGIQCAGGTTKCDADCVDLQTNATHCGSCGNTCKAGEVCAAGACVGQCPDGSINCNTSCVNLLTDQTNCGGCGIACAAGQDCLSGKCGVCDSATTDCDNDGWLVADGDCCDKSGFCGANPALVNPGAFEVVGNGIDDNCNGKVDLFDTEDTFACDTGLTSNSSVPKDYAKALGICRDTQETPANKADKTWGLISAEILRADGSALGDSTAKSIRTKFGNTIKTLEGASMVVLSSGIASDATQTNPGPSTTGFGGPSNSHSPSSMVNIQTCTDPRCIKDWFASANAPLKAANALPQAPGCGSSGGFSSPAESNDSVMIRLKMRAPTNARAFSFNSYFFSSEYPEFVCSDYNDQFVALVDTPGGTPSPLANPVDKNLLTYTDLTTKSKWPIGINIAKGTSLFAVCDPAVSNSGSFCFEADVNAQSCKLGVGDLLGTGFEASTPGDCDVEGGGTFWLTTAGNVVPGGLVELRIVIWDVGDSILDSLALVDGFKWLTNATLPGTG
ncbi:MAG TPA: choice-of-anchor L domain-containing protein [Polyangiaceae bacterium]|nr:choice-of-anchor L domain-containing protein [Polyangiaceae bacterium]